VDGRLAAQPEFYGLLLVRMLEGGRWLPLTSNAQTPLWDAAVQMPDGSVRFVIVNPSPATPAEITLRTPGYRGRASVQWLTGPSLAATSGVSLGGAQVGSDGTWRPDAPIPLAGSANSVDVHVPGATAALVSITDRSGPP